MADRSYRITATGKDARASDDTAIPTDYRRLMARIEGKTHFDVIRGRLREFPDQLLEEWLSELDELGFIETLPAESGPNLDFTDHFNSGPAKEPGVLPQDAERLARTAAEAGSALERSGLFLARERIANRPPATGAPERTTVLIVEDNRRLAAFTAQLFEAAGYSVVATETADAALDRLRAGTRIDAIFSDIVMPGSMSGVQFARAVRTDFPGIPILLSTGYSDAAGTAEREGARIISKPYDPDRVIALVGQLIADAGQDAAPDAARAGRGRSG